MVISLFHVEEENRNNTRNGQYCRYEEVIINGLDKCLEVHGGEKQVLALLGATAATLPRLER